MSPLQAPWHYPIWSNMQKRRKRGRERGGERREEEEEKKKERRRTLVYLASLTDRNTQSAG